MDSTGPVAADIAIAGGGIAGSLLALALAQAGFGVVLADGLGVGTRADPEFDGRAYAVAAGGARMLGALGLWQGLAGAAEPMREIVIAPPDGRGPPLLSFDHREGAGGPFAFMVEDRHLRGLLLSAVAGEPRIVHLAPAAVTALAVEPGRVRATLADGRELRAALLVASDGRAGAVAARAGFGHVGWAYPQTGLVAALSHARPHHGIARQVFLPGGPFAVLPLTGNRVSIVWSEGRAEAARVAALSDAAFHAALRERMALAGAELGETALVGRRWAYPLALSLAQSWVRPRVALLGDAAHGIHPLAGQGLNLALKDIAALVEVLALARRTGEDPGASDVLARYERWRRFDSVALGLACDAINRLFSTGNPVLRGLGAAGMRLAGGIGAVRRALMADAAGEAGTVPMLLRGEMP